MTEDKTICANCRCDTTAIPKLLAQLAKMQQERDEAREAVLEEHQAAVDMFGQKDEACDKLRIAMEALELYRDMTAYTRDGIGNWAARNALAQLNASVFSMPEPEDTFGRTMTLDGDLHGAPVAPDVNESSNLHKSLEAAQLGLQEAIHGFDRIRTADWGVEQMRMGAKSSEFRVQQALFASKTHAERDS